jgi:hypothetical protein
MTGANDDTRDAIALIRACLDDDTEAAEVITGNCDLGGVLAVVTGLAAEGLVCIKGEAGARVARPAAAHAATAGQRRVHAMVTVTMVVVIVHKAVTMATVTMHRAVTIAEVPALPAAAAWSRVAIGRAHGHHGGGARALPRPRPPRPRSR